MTGFHILIFDEDIYDGFLGVTDYPIIEQHNGKKGRKEASSCSGGKQLISNLPLWATFRVQALITQCYSGNVPMTVFSLQEKDVISRLNAILHKGEIGENIIIGRTGNITAIEWQVLEHILRPCKGPLKVQVGKVPSDLYVIKKSYLRRVMKQGEHGGVNIAKWLFDTHLFHNFERIVDISGFSFLMRNSYEYYRENMRIFDYMRNKGFLDFYGRLIPSSQKDSVVLENGVVRDCILGNGVSVDGTVEHSLISDDVTVCRGAVIRNSVILNSNVIEEDVRIENTLLFEGNGRIIGSGSVIGSEEEVDNNLYPEIIKRGLTVIGRYIPVPSYSRIGAGCLVLGSENPLSSSIVVSDCGVFDANKEFVP
ncbi:MAG: hypothetical protein JSV25_08575 [Spirochaetota bacterium]|nr:MAG: hypothetical protein JSV25_08575 [Spirochaetota bacterium]